MGSERFLATDIVKQQLDDASYFLGAAMPRVFREVVAAEFTNGQHDALESPLEAAFAVWWHAITIADYPLAALRLKQQRDVRIGDRTYRIDFVVDCNAFIGPVGHKYPVRRPKIAIELDGHAFHERTKEQVALRNQRDRDLQLDGWSVFHISGSEFYQFPAKCTSDVYAESFKLLKTWWRQCLLWEPHAG